MGRVTIVYSGISYQRYVLESDMVRGKYAVLPIWELPEADLSEHDVLVFPRGTDQEIMHMCRHKIKKFLDEKGIVITMGKVDPIVKTTKWPK